ncbi:MAG: NAD(P)H-hydrate dehydratase [FCB group bacterium]|jgi:NAD(P)H-hydrate epimerase
MKYILTPSEMRLADATAIEKYSIPSIILMENAARSAAEFIEEILFDEDKLEPEICILCGSGNNGGDGFAIARHLSVLYKIKILWIGSVDKMSPETEVNFRSIKAIGIPIKHIKDVDDIQHDDLKADCIIDALLGVGGSENVHGLAAYILNAIKEIDTLKIAIDAPTGLNTETGMAHPDCFKADYTITMFAIKTGMVLNDGIDVCGKIEVADLGAPEFIVESISKILSLEPLDVPDILIPRNKRSSKFDYGRVLIVAGSAQYPGAAALCSNSAITAGAGLVQLYTTVLHKSVLPEIIPCIVPSTSEGTISKDAFDIILKDSEKANVVVIGPGLGDNEETISLVSELISKLDKKVAIIIDADGLRAINANSRLRKNIILTPHSGEFSRITGIPRIEVEKEHSNFAKEWANKLNCTILLKHVPTVISDGEYSYWNLNGNPGMATGGSGDVLSGIIAGLLAQNIETMKAVSLGAFLHAMAGDFYKAKYSEVTLTASGILKSLKYILKKYLNFNYQIT